MRRAGIVLTLTLAFVTCPRPAAAWGFEVHKFIMARAIPLLPPELRPFFEKYQVTIVEHAIDPDLWRTAGWTAESPRHFVDMDAYGAFPFKDLPHGFDDAVAKYGRNVIEKNGTLPWRTEEIYQKLVEAFTLKAGYSRDNIKFFSSVIAHYTADAHVPFHAALNHDGQLSGQLGIHSRFETELFERYQDRLKIAPGAVRPIANAREFVFETLTTSFSSVQSILDADKAAVGDRELYDDAYFSAFFGKVEPTLEKRLSDSIASVASMITSAWTEGGRLPLPLEAPRTPRPVRRD